MKLDNLRKLFLVAAALLMVCQLGWAQTASIPPDKTLAAKAIAAVQASGKPVPVVPVASIAAKVAARPVIWLSGSVGVPTPSATTGGEPSLCEKPWPHGFIFCPAGLQTAYGVKQIVGANGGAGMTIAIVDAFRYDAAEADLATFDAMMGLPPCTTANGCFHSIVMPGALNGSGSGWDLESMLDLEYAHAMAPNAKLVYVQAYDNYDDSLGAAEAAAVAAGADIVSNSWSGDEYTSEDPYWNLGKVLLFASGDWSNWPIAGFVGYPCSALTVTCVGGTSLHVNTAGQRTSEVGWAGSGGGCSGPNPVPNGDTFGIGTEPMPAWQGRNGSDICSPYRAAPDIAAVADPSTGVAVWISDPNWQPYPFPVFWIVGGTSLATPVTAGLVADIDTARVSFGKAKFTFLNPSLYAAAASNYTYFFYDVKTGNNGYPAGTQFDLVTGLGVSAGPAMANRFFGLIFP